MTQPRAAGVHLPYPQVPARIRSWVSQALGSPVVAWDEQIGGFSPGCVTRVVTADRTRAFVKAVGPELNPDTPTLFRRERMVLELIGEDPLWASLRASYDDGAWVALLLEDIEGGHPDLSDDTWMDRLLNAVEALSERLARVPVPAPPHAQEFTAPGLVDVRRSFARWATAYDHLDEIPADLVPSRVRDRAEECRELVLRLNHTDADRHGSEDGLSHWDIRNDNLLCRADGSLVFVDWGAAGVGPRWVDPLLARLERVDDPWFDASLRSSSLLVAAGDELVTGWLLGLGGYLAWRSLDPVAAGLPTINAFRRTESRRLLAAAARRLGS